jgi:hypothetical protein
MAFQTAYMYIIYEQNCPLFSLSKPNIAHDPVNKKIHGAELFLRSF